jgi:hypothetical protein
MLTNARNRVNSPVLWGICLALILAVLGSVLLADPGADAPLGASALEGQLLLGARAMVPGQDIPLGLWAPEVLIPVQVRIDALAFRRFGVSLITARLVNVAAALLTVLLFFFVVRRSTGSGTALLAALFLAVNPVFIDVSRTALPSVFDLLLMLITIRVWVAGRRSGPAAFLSGALLVIAGLMENGPSTSFFLLAGLIMVLFLALHAWKMAWRERTQYRLRLFWFGAGLMFLVFLYRVVTHWAEVGVMWKHMAPVSPRMLAANVIMTPVYALSMVRNMPLLSVVALGYFLFFAKSGVRPLARHRRLDEVRLWFLAWLLAAVPTMVFGGRPNLYVLVLLVPPLCVLGAEGIVRLFALRRIERPRIDVMIVMVMIALFAWFLSAWLVHLFFSRTELTGYWFRHQIRSSLLAMLVGWVILTYFLGWLYLKWKRFNFPLRPAPVTGLAVLLLGGVLVLGISKTASWWSHRTHLVQRASSLVAGLGERDLVVGSWAPLLTLGHPARAAIIWDGVNDEPAPWHREIDYLLLQDTRESDPAYAPLRLFRAGRDSLAVRPVRGPVELNGGELRLYRVEPGFQPDG